MRKLIRLLAVAAFSSFMLAVPAVASALVPVHVVPKPTSATPFTGGVVTFSTNSGSFNCKEVVGTATWESSTTGTLNLTVKNDCTIMMGFTVSCPEIKFSNLPFHLITVGGKPGTLITPPAGGVFAKFTCAGVFTFEIKGNGLIDTITSPGCGLESSTLKISASGAAGVQAHKKVDGTETVYNLTQNGEEMALAFASTVAFPDGNKKLECT